ncbi:hypothetical protein HDU84_005818 [Entophlyctis sp. JEL0112]|nr:hypothetical protein HDU84_005818 [Entophlyctis sp. JEL0112]
MSAAVSIAADEYPLSTVRDKSHAGLLEHPSSEIPGFDVSADSLAQLISPHKDHAQLAHMGSASGILKSLGVDENAGLSAKDSADIQRRKTTFGHNRLPAVKPRSLFYFMLKALEDKIIILLSVVSLVSLAIGIYEDVKTTDPSERVHWIEGFSVLVAVIIVVLASSINDLQKEKQFRKLNTKKEDRFVKGVRDGQTMSISIYDIVVGDILLLEPGDVIAADGIFISGMGLKCDESSATGETDAIRKGQGHDLFIVSGSKVTEGIGRYVVTAVGEHSFFGNIMMAMRTENEDTPLQVKLDGLAERIAKLGTSMAILLFLLLFLKYIIMVLRTNGFGSGDSQESGTDVANQIVQILLVSIAIVAVAVPEGLPLAVTLSLAYATTRMMKDNNLVRVLSACETMGNATTICSDKTGTLTQNRMTVVTGVFGKNALFEGDAEIGSLKTKLQNLGQGTKDKLESADSDNDSPDQNQIVISDAGQAITSRSGSLKRPGPSGTELLEITMEGVALNSSVFEELNPTTGVPELVGSKTECALVEWSEKAGYDYKAIRKSDNTTIVQIYPFSSERKSMASLVKVIRPDGSTIYRLHVKGAPEIVMRYCDRVVLLPFDNSPTAMLGRSSQSDALTSANSRRFGITPAVGSRSNPSSSLVYPLDTRLKADYQEIIESFAIRSLRTIGLAFRDFSAEEFESVLNGSLKEKVKASKKAEKEAMKEQVKSKAREGLFVPSPEPSSVSLEDPPSLMALPAGNLVRTSTIGSSSLMIPTAQNGDASSFVESHLSEEEFLTDVEILSHPLAFTEFIGKGLIFGSVVGIEDPLRPGVIDAVQTCKDAGVFVRMVTGDNVMTAKSIATQCGIYERGVVPKLQILARSSPLDKQLLVSTLKSLGETVAVTGDGTNDGPALKMADIGFSMGIAGTEVAKEASSIILMDDSFSSVVKAILWGRAVNDSVKKFLQFQLSVNVSAVLITLISALADSNESSALSVVQLLWVNLIMDTMAALALATELPTQELLKRPPESKKAALISFSMWKMVVGQAFLQLTVNLVLLFSGPYLFGFQELIDAGGITGSGTSDIVESQKLTLRTVVFNSFVILQRLDNTLNVFKGIFNNPSFYVIFAIIVVAQAIIVQFGGVVFKTTALNGLQWLVCIIAGVLTLPWGIIIRLIPNEVFKAIGFQVHDDYVHNDLNYSSFIIADQSVNPQTVSAHSALPGRKPSYVKFKESMYVWIRGGKRREGSIHSRTSETAHPADLVVKDLPKRKMLFKVSREDLSLLVSPTKNQQQLSRLGGCDAILAALSVDPSVGIHTISKSNSTRKLPVSHLLISQHSSRNALQGPAPLTQVTVLKGDITEQERRDAFGENKLPPVRQNTIFDYMLAAISDKIMILLSTVSIVSLCLGLYEDYGPNADPSNRMHWVEGFSILVAVVIIVLVASMNDLQKEAKFRKLNSKKEDRNVKGIRNGETQMISIYSILVGDILLLEPGDVLAADGVLISAMGLKCDESSATGESDAVKKSLDEDSILLSGSQVIEGMGKYVVTSVGVHSFYGKIMMGMRIEMEDTPLQIKLDGLAERIAKFGAAGALFMFIVLISKYVITVLKANGFGNNPDQENGTQVTAQILLIIMQSVAIIAIAVPEGLPLAVTLALAYATTRMMKDNCLVRVISSCETMGNATTICSDKTGTLTQNRMTVVAGSIGKNVSFDGVDESQGLIAKLASLSKNPEFNPNHPIPNSKRKTPGIDGESLLSRIAEGLCLNSSVFQADDSEGRKIFIGSKTETALVEWVSSLGFSYSQLQENSNIEIVQMLPFSSERKVMATLVKVSNSDGSEIYRMHVKGAPEIILKSCDRIALLPFLPSKSVSHSVPAVGSRSNPETPLIHPLDAKLRKDCTEKMESFAQNSLRTICLAFRDFSVAEFEDLVNNTLRDRIRKQLVEPSHKLEVLCPNGFSADLVQSFESFPPLQKNADTMTMSELLSYSAPFIETFGVDLICASILGIEDPLRPGVEDAVKQCQNAGVFVRMVTGDNHTTALSIAKKCGIYQKGGIILEGHQFRVMSAHEREKILPRLQVLARSSPADKQLLVSSLKAMGEIVAVTGDGTNDGPALKLADVGFSMGLAGTEVAKEASSIILMDDSFASVVKAIIWGRCVNDSVKKFLQFQLSVNGSALILTLVSSILDSAETSVLTVVNLVIDTLAALSLGTEKPMPDVLDRLPEHRNAPLINFTMWKMILGQAILQITVNLCLLLGGAQFFGFTNLLDAGGILALNPSFASPEASQERLTLRTIVFNTFVLMQMFNQIK